MSSKSDLVPSHFNSGDEAPELDDYRPISPLVIAACVAGLVSLLAVFHPLLWVLPVVAAVLSVSAIVRVSSAHSRYSGRGAAVAALCLATLMGSYAPARSISRDRTLYAEAREKAEAWISLIQQGRLQEAHQLSLNASDRFKGPGSLDAHYAGVPLRSTSTNHADDEGMSAEMAGPSLGDQLKEFIAKPGTAKLLELGPQARIQHLGDVAINFEYGDLRITQRYRASGVHAGRPESFEFLVHATRREEPQFASWKVGDITLAK